MSHLVLLLLAYFGSLLVNLAHAYSIGDIPFDLSTIDTNQQAIVEFVGTQNNIVAQITFSGFSGSATQKPTTLVNVVVVSGLTDPTVKYPYHIHQKPVPSDGNCTGTGPHFDPKFANHGDGTYVCKPADLANCEEGDLSGKWGPLIGAKNGLVTPQLYFDEYLNWKGETTSFLHRSIVIHNQQGTRIACANITHLGSPIKD
ncbi:12219_t:CDS:2 [Ambispora gerdemannii]|uniref:12219_t:CDS:1 n=1 Tax=Ambispora gerdemannii TaxID=144530 RepID=A0A9N8WG84_9GLOM|nr:12219_t:CDS:2 [Ambispora gerdemannii]